MSGNTINPLRSMGRFNPHSSIVLDLPQVTTIIVDDRNDPDTVSRIKSITKWHRRFIRPAREVVVAGAAPDLDGIEYVHLPKWNGHYANGYSTWIQKELRHHFDTPLVLIWQTDGFAADPDFFDSRFLDYDYIGAPFHWDHNIVGNGGFSLRSKSFCEAVNLLPDTHADECIYFCVHKRVELNASGIRFSPACVSSRFSVEANPHSSPNWSALNGKFGYHSKNLMPVVERLLNARWIGPSRTLRDGITWDGNRLLSGSPRRDMPHGAHIANRPPRQ